MSMTHTNGASDNYQLESSRWSVGRNVLFFVAVVSVLACVAGYIQDPARFFRSYMVAFSYTAAIGLGAFFFVMVQYLSGSAWSVTVRRIMENIMITLPLGAVLFIPVAFGLHDIYSWTNAQTVAGDAVLRGKSDYLSENAFIIRTFVYFALWSIWIFAIYRQSTKQDTEHSARQMYVASRWSAPGLFLVIVVGTLASYDWLMSIQPKWYSTIFGLYILSGGGAAFMALMTVICLSFRRAGILVNSINIEHYHDLGKWMFAMTAFYTYIAFSQYLLIWYANLPDETVWYRDRIHGNWLWVGLAMPFVRFLIPFVTLLCRPAKRNLKVLAVMAVWILVFEYVDLYWVVMPAYYHDGPQPHWLDVTTLAATVSLCGLAFWGRFKRHKMVPVGDLRFEQGLHFENA